jgi:hypothetical protein
LIQTRAISPRPLTSRKRTSDGSDAIDALSRLVKLAFSLRLVSTARLVAARGENKWAALFKEAAQLEVAARAMSATLRIELCELRLITEFPRRD